MQEAGYNYESFVNWFKSPVLPKVMGDFKNNLKVGQPAPDFEGLTLDGYSVKLSSLKGKANVVLEFGCTTCPPFVNSVKYTAISLEKLYEEYKGKGFEFFIVYIREAHPGEKIGHHRSYEEKMRRAEELKEAEKITIPILVDSYDGQIHRAYGMRANAAFVINREGVLVHKAEWADTIQLKEVLDNILEYEHAMARGQGVYTSYSETLRTIDMDRWADLGMKRKILHQAGSKAIRDWKEMLKDSDPI